MAVLDFDVHHGNGTQDLLWDEARALFVSSHQMPLYPGTGAAEERGAHGQVVNLPLRGGSGGAAMRAVWARALDRVREVLAAQDALDEPGGDADADPASEPEAAEAEPVEAESEVDQPEPDGGGESGQDDVPEAVGEPADPSDHEPTPGYQPWGA